LPKTEIASADVHRLRNDIHD